MEEMKEFCIWFLSELPDFLMSEPICYLVGFAFLFVTIGLTLRIMGFGKKYM